MQCSRNNSCLCSKSTMKLSQISRHRISLSRSRLSVSKNGTIIPGKNLRHHNSPLKNIPPQEKVKQHHHKSLPDRLLVQIPYQKCTSYYSMEEQDHLRQ